MLRYKSDNNYRFIEKNGAIKRVANVLWIVLKMKSNFKWKYAVSINFRCLPSKLKRLVSLKSQETGVNW